MKSTRKEIVGLALLASLSIFAGTATGTAVKTNKADTEKITQPVPGKSAEKINETRSSTDSSAVRKEFPKPDAKRVEELKLKLRNGKVTKEEAEEIIKIMEDSIPSTDVEKEKQSPKK